MTDDKGDEQAALHWVARHPRTVFSGIAALVVAVTWVMAVKTNAQDGAALVPEVSALKSRIDKLETAIEDLKLYLVGSATVPHMAPDPEPPAEEAH